MPTDVAEYRQHVVEPHSRAQLEIANAAVDETRRMRRRAGAEVRLVDECRPEPAQRGIARNSRSCNAATDDQYVHGRLDHGRQGCGTLLLQLPSTWGWW